MKNKKKLLLILIIGTSLIIAQIFSFAFKRTSYQIVVYSNAQDTPKNHVKLDKSYEIVYHGLNDNNKQNADSSAYRVDVFVEKNTSLGILRYLPIYKPVSFKSKILYTWKISYKLEKPEAISNTDLMATQSGEFDISANYNLLGAYTKTKAEQLINELISKSIMTQIQKEIKNRLNP